MSIAYLGPPGSFTEAALAGLEVPPDAAVPYPSVRAALDAVRHGKATACVVPWENSVEGSVTESVDALAAGRDLSIVAETLLRVRFALGVPPAGAGAGVGAEAGAGAGAGAWVVDEAGAVTQAVAGAGAVPVPGAGAWAVPGAGAQAGADPVTQAVLGAVPGDGAGAGTVDGAWAVPGAVPGAGAGVGVGALALVRRVLTHPIAHAQCRTWLGEHLPRADVVTTASTAQAAKEVGAQGAPGLAAIAAPNTLRRYGLHIVASDIGDRHDAVTRFVKVTRPTAATGAAPTGVDRTSLVVPLADQMQHLHAVLREFARCQVPLTAVLSRPGGFGLGSYSFLLECEGHIDDPGVGLVVAALTRRHAAFVLGSYPRADLGRPALSR